MEEIKKWLSCDIYGPLVIEDTNGVIWERVYLKESNEYKFQIKESKNK